MGGFKHLSYGQRLRIKELLDAGFSKTTIAKTLDINDSTVYREIARGSANGEYDPEFSQSAYRQHLSEKGPATTMFADEKLKHRVSELILNERLSPAQIVERLQAEKGGFDAIPKSVNTIYRAIDSGLIPDVTRERLRMDTTTVFNDGNIHLAKWIRSELNINDGDVLHIRIEDGKLIYTKQKD